MSWSEIADTIRNRRRDMRLSQNELAQIADVSRPTIARIESATAVHASKLLSVAEALDLQLTLSEKGSSADQSSIASLPQNGQVMRSADDV